MAVYIQIHQWSGADPAAAEKHLAKVFRFPESKAKSVLNWLSQGKKWKHSKPVSDTEGEKALAYLLKLGFDVELLDAPDKPIPKAKAHRASSSDDQRIFDLKRIHVFFVILLATVTLGIYIPYWFQSRREAFNQLDSQKKFSESTIQIVFILMIGVVVASFLIAFMPGLKFLAPILNLVNLGCWIAIIVFGFKARRILLDHMEANYREPSKMSGILTFFFIIYYIQYKINSAHKYYEKNGTGDVVFRGDGLAWAMACLFLILPFGIIAAIAIPQFNSYKGRAFDSEAKSNLHNYFLACKAYWADNGSRKNCTVEIASQSSYGYIKSPGVVVLGSGAEKSFSVLAYHENSESRFIMDANGQIFSNNGAAKPAAEYVSKSNPEGYAPIHYAAMDGDMALTRRLLSLGHSPDALSKNNETPLHWAAIKGHSDVTRILLEGGANPNILSSYGPAPLHLAIEYKHKGVVEELVEKGADVNMKASNGWTPLYMAEKGGQSQMIQYLKSQGAG